MYNPCNKLGLDLHEGVVRGMREDWRGNLVGDTRESLYAR